MRALRLFSLISLQALTCVALGQQPASPAVPGSAATPSPAAQSSRNDPCRQGSVAPRRDPHSPGFVAAVEIADGQVPPAERDGNFVLGPTHLPAPETSPRDGVPQGTLYEFTMESTASKLYPGIAREPGTFGTPDPYRPRKADRHHQPPRALYTQAVGRLCSQAIRRRHAPRRSSSALTAPTRSLFDRPRQPHRPAQGAGR